MRYANARDLCGDRRWGEVQLDGWNGGITVYLQERASCILDSILIVLLVDDAAKPDMNAGIPQHPPPIVILRYLGKQVLRWAPLLLVLLVTGFKSLTFGALVLTLLAIMWSAAWSRM